MHEQQFPRPGVRGALTLIALAVALALAAPAQAQNMSLGKGRLQGIVKDTEGNPVAGATILLTHLATSDTYTVTTDENGRWIKGNMGSGQWNIDITAAGFAPKPLRAQVRDFSSGRPFETILEPGDPATTGGTSTFGGELGNRVNAANEMYSMGDFQGALAAFELLLTEEEAKESPNANIHLVHVNAGNAAFELNDYDKAAGHFAATLAADAENQEARLGLANVYMMQRKFDEAMAEIGRMDLAAIADPVVFYNIGEVLFNQGQSEEAQGYYELAIDRSPGFVDAHMKVALCLIQRDKGEEAKPHLLKVIELDPDSENGAVAQQFLDYIG